MLQLERTNLMIESIDERFKSCAPVKLRNSYLFCLKNVADQIGGQTHYSYAERKLNNAILRQSSV